MSLLQSQQKRKKYCRVESTAYGYTWQVNWTKLKNSIVNSGKLSSPHTRVGGNVSHKTKGFSFCDSINKISWFIWCIPSHPSSTSKKTQLALSKFSRRKFPNTLTHTHTFIRMQSSSPHHSISQDLVIRQYSGENYSWNGAQMTHDNSWIPLK